VYSDRAPYYERPDSVGLIFATAALVIVTGLRCSGGDTVYYWRAFNHLEPGISNLAWFNDGIVFYFFRAVVRTLTDNPQIYIFLTALITYPLFMYVMYHYSEPFEMGVFVFFCSGVLIQSMNGIRQYMASAIIFAGLKLLLENKWKRYILLILFASLIHASALVMIPIVFFVRRKAWSMSTFMVLFSGLAVVAIFPSISPQIAVFLEDTYYERYLEEFSRLDSSGANYIRALVAAVPVLLAYMGKDKLKEFWPESDIIVNLSIMNFLLMTLSTHLALIARVNFYTMPYNCILIPILVSKIFVPKHRKFIYLLVILLYGFYFFYEGYIFYISYETLAFGGEMISIGAREGAVILDPWK